MFSSVLLLFLGQAQAGARDLGSFVVEMTPIISAKGCRRKASPKTEVWSLSQQGSGRVMIRVKDKQVIYAGYKQQGVLEMQSVRKSKGKVVSTSILNLSLEDGSLTGHRMVTNSAECGYLYAVKGEPGK